MPCRVAHRIDRVCPNGPGQPGPTTLQRRARCFQKRTGSTGCAPTARVNRGRRHCNGEHGDSISHYRCCCCCYCCCCVRFFHFCVKATRTMHAQCSPTARVDRSHWHTGSTGCARPGSTGADDLARKLLVHRSSAKNRNNAMPSRDQFLETTPNVAKTPTAKQAFSVDWAPSPSNRHPLPL